MPGVNVTFVAVSLLTLAFANKWALCPSTMNRAKDEDEEGEGEEEEEDNGRGEEEERGEGNISAW